MKKTLSPAGGICIALILVIIVFEIGWFIFVHPNQAKLEKARTLEAKLTPQAGDVVEWDMGILPDFAKINLVLDSEEDGYWTAHGEFVYSGQRVDITCDTGFYNSNIPKLTLLWKVWRENDEPTSGIASLPYYDKREFKVENKGKVMITRVDWVEAIRNNK